VTSFLKRFYARIKYGKPIILVSGLPRSGTSMMMKMLDAAGMEIVCDGIRTADEDNPKGYYEFERVKDLDKDKDKSWLGESKGKVIKIISFLLKDLPLTCNYRVIFMLRDLEEIIASQNKMLVRRGEPTDTASDEKMIKNYEKHLRKVKFLLAKEPNFEVLYVKHRDCLERPLDEANRLNRFLGGSFDVEKIAGVVDESLYRNRR